MAAIEASTAPLQYQTQSGRKGHTGALFINNKKTTETQPDYKGQVEIDGRKFWISSWVNTSNQGRAYQRLILEDFTDEDYRKSAEIEAARQANTNQAPAANWSRPAASNVPPQQPVSQPIHHNVQNSSGYNQPTPPDDFDDD